MEITVLHGQMNRETYKMDGHVPVARVTFMGNDIDAGLEYAWRWTNNVQGSWSRGETVEFRGQTVTNGDFNPNVEVLAELPVENGETYGLRSSMVGDIFEVDGVRYVVDMIGFEKLEDGVTETEVM